MTGALYILDSSAPRQELGGKAGALAALAGTSLPIPPWFAVSPAAFAASVTPAQRAACATGGAEAAASALSDLAPAPDVTAAITEAVTGSGGELFAVRSSAADEDSEDASFAGQLESYLFVASADVPARVGDVWRSGFAARVFAYRREQNLAGPPKAPAVLVQRMVTADTAGVAFGADPVDGRRDVAVVSAVIGLGSALVSGDADADTWRVDESGGITQRSIATKRTAHRFSPDSAEGVAEAPVDANLMDEPTLTDTQILQVAALVRAASEHFGRPQDVEWAFQDGELFLLQSRPITTLPADAGSELNLWDNSNIAESYGGVTTPLTFSFARHAYTEVYKELCRILGVSEAVIEANGLTFGRMLGLVHGRVYYNLPDELLAEQTPASGLARLADALRLARTAGGLLVAHATLPKRIERFNARLDAALEPKPLDAMHADELAAYYRDLEKRLLTHWDAPLVNDFFAMVFFGLLTAACRRWIDPSTTTLQNDLLTAEGGMISAEPAQRVREMAGIAARDASLVRALGAQEGAALDASIAAAPEFAAAYRGYLARFGDRCIEELKLESPTLEDDPLPLLRSVACLASNVREGDQRPAAQDDASRIAAEEQVRIALAYRPLRRLTFAWVLRHARARVRDRENLRFERTRLFGRVRRIFLALGREYGGLGVLDDARDVFYLEAEEALGFADGTATVTDLRGVASARRALFDAYRAEPDPPSRFETRGAVGVAKPAPMRSAEMAVKGKQLEGIGCCPGVVRGRVRLVIDPRADSLSPGEILVAERTDPGWVMLFPAASGILVERGSLLSHSAIVAREMGIPAVVSLPGLMGWLNTGDLVEFDGTAGTVTRLERAEPTAAETPVELSEVARG